MQRIFEHYSISEGNSKLNLEIGSKFKVQGLRFKVQGSRFKVQGSRCEAAFSVFGVNAELVRFFVSPAYCQCPKNVKATQPALGGFPCPQEADVLILTARQVSSARD